MNKYDQPTRDLAAELFDELIASVREHKESICAGEPNDIPVQVAYVPQGQAKLLMVISAPIDMEVSAPDQVRFVLATIANKEGPPRVIGFMADAYMREHLHPGDIENIQRGDITQAFHEGDERVHEVLQVSVHYRDDDGTIATLNYTGPYHYHDDLLVFDDEFRFSTPVAEVGGAVDEIIRAAFAVEAN